MTDITELFDPSMRPLELDDGAISDLSSSFSPPSLDSEGFSDSAPDSTLPTPPSHPHPAGKRKVPPKRTVFSRRQLGALEARFCQQSFLSREERREFAAEVGITERQVMIWFQNRRGRLKKRGPSDRAYNACKLDELNAKRPYPLLYGMISSANYQNPAVCQQIMSLYPESVQQTAQSALGPANQQLHPHQHQQMPWAGQSQGGYQGVTPQEGDDSATISRLLSYQQRPAAPSQTQVYHRFSSDPQKLQQCLSVTQLECANTAQNVVEERPRVDGSLGQTQNTHPGNHPHSRGDGHQGSEDASSTVEINSDGEVDLTKDEIIDECFEKTSSAGDKDDDNQRNENQSLDHQKPGNQLAAYNAYQAKYESQIMRQRQRYSPYHHQGYHGQYQQPQHHHGNYNPRGGDRNNNPAAAHQLGSYDYSHLMSAAYGFQPQQQQQQQQQQQHNYYANVQDNGHRLHQQTTGYTNNGAFNLNSHQPHPVACNYS